MAPTGIAGPVRPAASLFHDEDRVAESGETARMALYAINNGVRQYDFREVRLTSGAQRGLALGGQSRPVLSAHYKRGGQP